MFRAVALAALTALATGCAHKVPVRYLQAAQIDVDQDVRTVLVVDRSGARGVEHVLDAAEGAATGESFHLDADSAAIALQAFHDVVADGRRFAIVTTRLDRRGVDTSLTDRPLPAHRVRQLCAAAGCDAVVSLDAFDSDHLTDVVRERDGDAVAYEASQTTDVFATFRLYDGRTGLILDEQRGRVGYDHASGAEDTVEEATAALPYEHAVFDGAASLGVSYATRISPHVRVDHRTLYANGHIAMRTAHKAARRGNLRAAIPHWEALAAGPDSGLAAKALYNLAVVAEADGDLTLATQHAHHAATRGGRDRMHRYVDVLARRSRNDRRVKDQLGAAVATW